tara:strand:+ start:133 stop:378 length:246 start_codon:yes stop_codon:yes gene_type:complete
MEDYSKFEFFEITDNEEMEVSVTRKLKCKWNNKQFVLHHQEYSVGDNKFYWIEGEGQFTQDERCEIEKYLYEESGEDFWLK